PFSFSHFSVLLCEIRVGTEYYTGFPAGFFHRYFPHLQTSSSLSSAYTCSLELLPAEEEVKIVSSI
ncbi:hypothetical protein, partial [Porphyromonas gulae]|uniref:hypothetical protein n=1 Tax=Porphyromonas gulae TaxID=111105 RepID=UPI00057E90F2